MLRQLDQRESDGVTITLEWDPETNHVQIRCEDEQMPEPLLLCYPVEPRDARLAFLNPFAFA
jgi:hypothetical protein